MTMRMKSLALALLVLAACQSKQEGKVKGPHPDLVTAMAEYCKIGTLPKDQQVEAQKAWGYHWSTNKEVGPVWNLAARDKHRDALFTVHTAAEQAMGKGNCPILDSLPRP